MGCLVFKGAHRSQNIFQVSPPRRSSLLILQLKYRLFSCKALSSCASAFSTLTWFTTDRCWLFASCCSCKEPLACVTVRLLVDLQIFNAQHLIFLMIPQASSSPSYAPLTQWETTWPLALFIRWFC